MSKPKAIKFELIEEDSEPYLILNKMRRYHAEIADAVVGLAWRKELKPDKDGHLVLGKCVKATDLQREFANYDFIILLNQEVWESGEFTDEKKCALMDHELCHATVASDEDGEKWDDRGRKVWRTRKHDIEEFHCIIQRHGCYKRDLEHFAELLLKKKRTPLLNQAEERQQEHLQ